MFTVISMLSEIFLTYEIFLLMRCFFKECRFPRYVELLAYVILYAMLTMPNLLLGIPIVNLICSFGSEMLITVCYRGSWKKRILSGVFVFGIFTLSECIVALLSGYINLSLIESLEYYSIFGIICLPVVQLLIVLLVRNFSNMREGEEVPISYWIVSLTLPILTVFLFVLFYQSSNLNFPLILTCTAVLFAINVLVIYLYDYQIQSFQVQKEKEMLELQNQYQRSQLELMNETVEKSREQRHDFLKHISMISYLNEKKDAERLSSYLAEIQGNMKKDQQFVDTGNFILDGILNYKIQEAISLEIRMEVEVKVPEDLELSLYDMNIILTNLLDNSIEAVKRCEDKQIDVRIVYSKSRLDIRICNPYHGTLKKERGHFVTTKKDSTLHGYGLKNVEKIVKKYDGTFEVKTVANTFVVSVCLFL